eukprot:jgi/Psemu1/325073/estExt_fgenesh1_pg.C_2000025
MRKWHRASKSTEFLSSPRLLRKRTSDRTGTGTTKTADDAELILTLMTGNSVRSRHTIHNAETDANTPIPLSKRFASFGGPEVLHEHRREREQPPEETETPSLPGSIDHQSDVFRRHRSECRSEHPHPPSDALCEEWTIPVQDICTIRTYDEKPKTRKRNGSKCESSSSYKAEHRLRRTIGIETTTFGSFELLMESTNELLVLTTFLKINATTGNAAFVTSTAADFDCDGTQPTTIGANHNGDGASSNDAMDSPTGAQHTGDDDDGGDDDVHAGIVPNPSNVTHDTAQTDGDKSIDVEGFFAKRMSERLNRETLTEKVERRMHRLVSSLEELTTSLNKCVCVCFGDSTVTQDQSIAVEKERMLPPRPRRNTASTVSLSETGENNGDDPVSLRHLREQRKVLMKQAQIPSGLSVEPEDYLEDLVLHQSPSSPGGGTLRTKASI